MAREKEELEKIEKYAKERDEMVLMRKMKQDKRFQEQQAMRQRLIDAQTERLKAIKQREEDLIARDVKEAEIKAENYEAEKQRKRAELRVSPDRDWFINYVGQCRASPGHVLGKKKRRRREGASRQYRFSGVLETKKF
jgi:hypothetical protein